MYEYIVYLCICVCVSPCVCVGACACVQVRVRVCVTLELGSRDQQDFNALLSGQSWAPYTVSCSCHPSFTIDCICRLLLYCTVHKTIRR